MRLGTYKGFRRIWPSLIKNKTKIMKVAQFKVRLMVEDSQALVTPLPGGAYIQKLSEVLGTAKISIDVMQYQWNWYPFKPQDPVQKMNQQICGIVRTGVKVRVLLNIEGASHRLTTINQQAKRNLEQAGAAVKFGPQFPITHAKIFIVDKKRVILGSHNLSSRSVVANDETSVLIDGKEVAGEFTRYFNLTWARI